MANEQRLYTKHDLADAFRAQTGRSITPVCIRDLACHGRLPIAARRRDGVLLFSDAGLRALIYWDAHRRGNRQS